MRTIKSYENRMIEKLKFDEKSLKKNLEHLNNEIKMKNDSLEEHEEEYQSINNKLIMKRNELNMIEKKLEEFTREKEMNKNLKLEMVQLSQEVKISNICMYLK